MIANAGARGYYRAGYEENAVRAMARDAETKLSPAERIALQSDIWASVQVGREPVGDYLAFAQGLQSDRNRAVLDDVLRRLGYIERYLVSDSDREAYRAWLSELLTPAMNQLGWEPKLSDTDEQKDLRSHLFHALGYNARDPQALAEARSLAQKGMADPASVDREMLFSALRLAALNGDSAFYDQLVTAMKNAKSPEEYYMYFESLSDFGNPKLLERTLDYAISPEVRSQDALQLITGVLDNPAGQQLAWDFIRQHWPEVDKAGGPFASAEVVDATSVFCNAGMRDEVTEFFTAHKVAGAERTYKQSIERINNCVDLKSQQEPQLASWLGSHGGASAK